MKSSKRADDSKLILLKQHDLWTFTQVLDAKDLHAHILYELDVGRLLKSRGSGREGGGLLLGLGYFWGLVQIWHGLQKT